MANSNKLKSALKFAFLPWRTEKQSGRFWGTIALLLIILFAVLLFQTAMHLTAGHEFCISCHEMEYSYNYYKKSKHGSSSSGVSVECVKCHLPTDPVGYLYVKARDGMKDLFIHVFNPVKSEEEWIERKEELDETARGHIKNSNCMKCHKDVKPQSEEGKETHAEIDVKEDKCVECHTDFVHIL